MAANIKDVFVTLNKDARYHIVLNDYEASITLQCHGLNGVSSGEYWRNLSSVAMPIEHVSFICRIIKAAFDDKTSDRFHVVNSVQLGKIEYRSRRTAFGNVSLEINDGTCNIFECKGVFYINEAMVEEVVGLLNGLARSSLQAKVVSNDQRRLD